MTSARRDARHWLRRLTMFVALAVVALAGVGAVQYGIRFHTLAFWQLPSRIA